jgi:tRNA-binding EMAP/Myf-like protein
LAIGVNAVYLIGHLIQPFLPTVSEAIFEQVGKPMTPIFLQDEKFVFVPTLVLSGRKIGAPEPLFRNIDAEEVEALRTKFGGDATMEGEVFPLDLRVVTVIACISHPDPTAMNYWMLTVDCGEADQRLVSAGDLLISDRADITLNEASSAVDNVVDLRTKSPTEPRVPHEEVVPSVPHKEVVPSVPHKEVVPSAGETKEEKKIVLHTNAWLSRRTIVSELRSHYRAEELVGKRVIAAINTKPHQIKKVVSQGIILRASQTKMCGVLTSTQIPGTRVVPRGSPVELSPTFDPAKHWQRLNLVLRADSIAHFGSLPLEANGVSVSAERAPPGTHLDY